jgi:hypothetical protein
MQDLLVALAPAVEAQWSKAAQLGKGGAPVVALNAPFSTGYDIGQGGRWELVYILKRVTRGEASERGGGVNLVEGGWRDDPAVVSAELTKWLRWLIA